MKLFDQLVKLQEIAAQKFKKDGEVLPCLFVSDGDEIKIIAVPGITPEIKEGLATFLAVGIQAGKVKEFALIAECFAAPMSKDTASYRREHGTLAGYDKANSKLAVFYSSPKKEGASLADIQDGKLSEWSPFEPGTRQMSTVFGNLWAKSHATDN